MLIPRPRVQTPGVGAFALDRSTRITATPEVESTAQYLQGVLRPSTGLPLFGTASVADAGIVLRLADDTEAQGLQAGPADDRSESFRLTVTADRVEIVGGGPAGVFYGAQAFLQLLPADVYRAARITPDGADEPWTVAAVTVEDAPAFAWRGFMLDVARTFRTKHEVLRVIDQIAAHRINRFHFHLTEDQGWRIEIRKYPRLTDVGAWRTESQVGAHVPGADGELTPAAFDGRPHGGYYTQDDIREIVAYAAERFVTVVPEIETPGHVRAALAAYPELGVHPDRELGVWTEWGIAKDILNTEDSTVRFFQDVLDEVMALFPSEYIGIGGDECPKDQWVGDARTQERIRELGLDDEEQLQAWFVGRLGEHVERAGRRIFGWDEILEGGTLSRSATILSWRGMQGAITAARRGYDVISVPDDQAYFDYRQSDLASEPIPVAITLTTADVHAFDPVPAELDEAEAAHVIGGQANMWTEHVDTARRLDYMLFPRLVALAEALWSADVAGPRDLAEFEGRLGEHLARLEAMGIEYRHESGPFPWEQRPGVPGRPSSREDRAAFIAAITANIAD
ncbi:beta-N-acetylhexosaminidase [Curtobacterium sp. Leaf261]|uniref:beta-N-acetylhexosaminidase n=1 Tax=Curtobacterium sp. Leaf261 TaxID=1736311 RepID=UPI0009EC684C|nr:beta-N-acetylhexosaminidase [Curtobacterium sp. Leaf261]